MWLKKKAQNEESVKYVVWKKTHTQNEESVKYVGASVGTRSYPSDFSISKPVSETNVSLANLVAFSTKIILASEVER